MDPELERELFLGDDQDYAYKRSLRTGECDPMGRPLARHVIYGPHFDIDPEDPGSLRDPFRMARRFAHAIAKETGEPFAWGWYATPEGVRPAVCAVEYIPLGFFTDGVAGAKVAGTKVVE
jgi:hypothetical protein